MREIVENDERETMSSDESDITVDDRCGIGPVAIATGLGWVLGGPLGAAVLGGTAT